MVSFMTTSTPLPTAALLAATLTALSRFRGPSAEIAVAGRIAPTITTGLSLLDRQIEEIGRLFERIRAVRDHDCRRQRDPGRVHCSAWQASEGCRRVRSLESMLASCSPETSASSLIAGTRIDERLNRQVARLVARERRIFRRSPGDRAAGRKDLDRGQGRQRPHSPQPSQEPNKLPFFLKFMGFENAWQSSAMHPTLRCKTKEKTFRGRKGNFNFVLPSPRQSAKGRKS